jgi:hypothetical protein
MRSPLTLTLAPETDGQEEERVREAGERVVHSYLGGLRQLEGGSVPADFDEEALESSRKLAKALTPWKAQVTLSSPGERSVTATPQVAEVIEQVVAKAVHTSVEQATLEGRLEVLSTHQGDHFVIWEMLTGNRVECRVTPEQLEQAKGLLRQRVAVSGRAHYRKGKPVLLQVESFRALRGSSELPQPKDIGKVDITGGLSELRGIRPEHA